jgi:GDP-L-fucose synthase
MESDKQIILVTGGNGQVGMHLRELIPNATYLSSADGDLRKLPDVVSIFEKYKPNVVIHLAAKVGGITENVAYPADYFVDNLAMNMNVVETCARFKVDTLIAVLSTCIYPDRLPDDHYPMKESMLHLGPPTPTNFGYGYAKRCMAVHIDAMNKQHKTRYQYLTPCNLFGPYDKYNERSHFVGALLQKIKDAKASGQNKIKLMGDGTPLRQFMYAGDLALAVKYCIDSGIRENFNVAPDYNMSIMEIAEVALQVCEADLEIEWSGKLGGQYRKDVSNYWMKRCFPTFPFTDLRTGLKMTWDKIK